MKNIKTVLACITFFTILLMFSGAVSAANVTINPGDSIQSAIDNASDNDTIIVNDNNGSAYTYTENVVINKTLSLQAKTGGNVNVNSFIINSNGNGSTIQKFIITNGITLSSTKNCLITGNTVTNTGIELYGSTNNTISDNSISNSGGNGIFLECGSNNNTILNNTLFNNYYDGMEVCSSNNIIMENTVTNNWNSGIEIYGSNNVLSENDIKGNKLDGIVICGSNNITITENNVLNNARDGIRLENSSANINFNRITGNNLYGLYSTGNGTINATNNWWGSNNLVVSSSSGSDVYIVGGNVTYDPWLVLNVIAIPNTISSQNPTDSVITTDLTHNNAGNDTSSQGHIPDNIPIGFLTNMGTVTNLSYTRNGKAIAMFNCNATSGKANITATLDNQTVQANVTMDSVPPIVNVSLPGGDYDAYQYVTLTATDNVDPNPVIYYTLDGTTPTTSSTIYTAPIHIIKGSTTLKFIAVDAAGNQALIQTVNYTLTLPIIDLNTGNVYSTIQNAINDPLTLNGDVIQVSSGIYVENIVVNKNLTIKSVSGNNVTIQAANPNNPVITITSSGSGSTIRGLNIIGATGSSGIYLSGVSNCVIYANTISSNKYGIYLDSANNNQILDNTITGNTGYGINIVGLNATVSGNNINGTGNAGMIINGDNATVTGNNVTSNGFQGWSYWSQDGISVTGANAIVSENNVTGNKGTGISVSGNNAQILQNVLFQNGGYGIGLTSVNATVINNNMTDNGNAGMKISCDNVTISNNTVVSNGNRGWSYWSQNGIDVTGNNAIITPDNIIHDNHGTGLNVNGNNITLTGFTIYNNGGYGIYIAGTNSTAINNNVTNNGNAGIIINSNNITVSGNNVTSNGNSGWSYWSQDGIGVTGDNVTVINNNVTINHGTGISVSGNNALILQNVLFQNGGYGIGLTSVNATVINNNMTDNGNAGMKISCDNVTISNNTVVSNGNRGWSYWSQNGIDITGNNAIITPDNVIHDNGKTGLYVRGNNITLTGFTIYNNGGYGIDISGLNITVSGNNMTNNGNAGLLINSNGVIVSNNTLVSNGNRGFSGWSWNGVSVTGTNATVSGNVVTNNGGYGLYVSGDNATITHDNVIHNNGNTGLYVRGNNITLTGFNIYSNGGYGIDIAGTNLTVSWNNVTGNSKDGITINGANATVSGNTGAGNGWAGISIYGDGAVITPDNVIHDNRGDGLYVRGNNITLAGFTIYNNSGYGINAAGTNLTVSGNNVTGNGKDGINVNSAGVVVSGNIGTGNGWAGIVVTGDNAIITGDNVIHDNRGDGLYVRGNNITLAGFTIYNNSGYGINAAGTNLTVSGNNVTGNGKDGMLVDGASAIISNNTGTGNGWAGIAVTGSDNTIISNNSLSDNRGDGLYVRGNNVQVLQNSIARSSGYGINAAGTNLTVSGNNVTGNGKDGMLVDGASAIIFNNTGTGNGWAGIAVTGSDNTIIFRNNVSNNRDNGIYIRGNNVQVLQNSIAGSTNWGINAVGSNITISENNVTSNGKDGINVNGVNATVTGNNVTFSSLAGIYVTGTGAVVSENTATNNQYGIYLSNSSANVNFNRIAGNSKYGLYNTGNGVVNATNNWWGSNNPLVSSAIGSDIYIAGGNVTYNPWLVLNVTADPAITNNNSTITADLTHNNAGEDTSPQGNVPDNVPINFATNMGTITSSDYTKKGKASATFTHGNSISEIANITATLDNQTVQINVTKPLTIFVNQIGGLYNTTQNVTLTSINPNDNSTIYYTINGSDPQVNGIVYSSPILINSTTTFRYVATDNAGKWGPEYAETYTIDMIAPIVSVNVPGGVYNTTQTINLTITDNLDSNPVIYYTLNGTDPTTSSTIYTGPITIQMDNTIRTITTLKFMAVDLAGNHVPIQTLTYILTLPVVDTNTSRYYSNIQDAINDSLTLNGHTIEIYSGTLMGNIIVNKKLTIKSVSGNNVIIQAADASQPVFTFNSDGTGSMIQSLTINGNINLNVNNCSIYGNILNGSIHLQANNCSIYGNTIYGNGTSAIMASNSFNNTIFSNSITSVGFDGIHSSYSNNTIYGNIIYGCNSGIYSEHSNNYILSNNLTGNYYGIWTYNSTDTIQFNIITGNTYGLRNDMGTVNATNNWWGSNADPSTIPADICNQNGTVIYNPWLVLSVNASPTNSGGNTSVTADLTHNNQGEDTSSQGHIPNGIPVNFTTTLGTIIGTGYTVKGKASTILNLGSTQNATVTATASLDNQTVSTTGFIATGGAVLNITSTAIDNSTGQPLNITYAIPLNESVTWLSVLWINKDMFTDELQVIVDGTIVQDKYFHNAAYTTWKDSYSPSVFNAIVYTNYNLQFASDSSFWSNLVTKYNLTDSDLAFLQNNRKSFIDNLTFNILYSGVSGLNMSVIDPKDSNVFNLSFTGNVINRVSQVIYDGSGYEGVKSFAIATTNVTTDVLQYWWDQYSNYQMGDAMNAAYNTFLTALMMEYYHDQIADNITTSLNVTWSRTSPVIVSVGQDAYDTYMTLECDHSMGMTVVGTPENMWLFNYITSYYISPIEDAVMSNAYNSTFNSVMMDLFNTYLNNSTYLEDFEENGFIIEKSIFNDNEFLVLDLETGIVRDIDTVNNFYGGSYKTRDVWGCIKCISIIGNKLYHWQTSNPWDLGSYNFIWDGLGKVFLTSSPSQDPSNNIIHADNELTITGAGGTITFDNYSLAIDITNILNQNVGLGNNVEQSIHLVVKDTDGGFIGTSPLYLVKMIKIPDKDDDDDGSPFQFPFPIPTPTWPPLPWNTPNPPYNPFPCPPSDVPLNNDHYPFHFPPDVPFNPSNGIPPEVLQGGEAIGVAIVFIILWIATGGAISS